MSGVKREERSYSHYFASSINLQKPSELDFLPLSVIVSSINFVHFLFVATEVLLQGGTFFQEVFSKVDRRRCHHEKQVLEKRQCRKVHSRNR